MGLPIIDNAFALLKRANTWFEDQVFDSAKLIFKNNFGNVLVLRDNHGDSKIFSEYGTSVIDMGGGEWTSNALRVSNYSSGATGILVGTTTAGGLPATIGHINAANYQSNGADLPFQIGYESSEQTIVDGGLITLSHGLGAEPAFIDAHFVCKVAESGYSVGDKVKILLAHDYDSNSTSGGFACCFDAGSLHIRCGASAQSILNKDTGIRTKIINGNWKLVVRAWA